MTKMIFISLPVTDLDAAVAFYNALGFEQNPRLSDDTGACMAWSESIQVMLITHAKWRTFTQRPFPPSETASHMLSLTMDSREAVDAANTAAAANGGTADVNPAEDLGFMYTRDFADPDGHVWAALWMDPAADPSDAAAQVRES
jgi:predicted lactoylglutathione lyase